MNRIYVYDYAFKINIYLYQQNLYFFNISLKKFSGKRCLSIRNHKPQTSYSGKRRDEMFRDEAYEMGSEFKRINWFIRLNLWTLCTCRTIVLQIRTEFKQINQFIPLNSFLICRTIVRHVHKVHKSVSGHPRWISIILIIAGSESVKIGVGKLISYLL